MQGTNSKPKPDKIG